MESLINLQESPPRGPTNSIPTRHSIHPLNESVHQDATPAVWPTPSLGTTSRSRHTQTTFIVAGNPELVLGVIEAVHRELVHASKNCSIELRSTQAGPYLRITAPTKEDADALIETAQMRAQDLISHQPSITRGLFVEPPSSISNNFQIELRINDATGEARPYLNIQNDIGSRPCQDTGIQEYTKHISDALLAALKKEGRFHTSLTIRIHLGHYVLKRFPRGSHTYDYRRFEAMVNNPRATGSFKTQIGDGALALATLNFIRGGNSHFVPIDSQTPSASHVVPDYVFEACSQDARFEANLTIINNSKRPTQSSKGSIDYYQMSRARVYPRNARIVELGITSISLGKKLDWKLEVASEDLDERKFHNVYNYFQSAKIWMNGPCSDFNAYPTVSLERRHPLAARFKTVAVKSAYRFSWKATGYTVEISINRRWDSIREMVDQAQPVVDCSIRIYGETWDEDTRMASEGIAGNIWGEDLQFLFRDESNGGNMELPGRVREFLEMVRDVRDDLEDI